MPSKLFAVAGWGLRDREGRTLYMRNTKQGCAFQRIIDALPSHRFLVFLVFCSYSWNPEYDNHVQQEAQEVSQVLPGVS